MTRLPRYSVLAVLGLAAALVWPSAGGARFARQSTIGRLIPGGTIWAVLSHHQRLMTPAGAPLPGGQFYSQKWSGPEGEREGSHGEEEGVIVLY